MFIDIHIHACAWGSDTLELDDVTTWMDDHRVEQCVVLQHERSTPRTDEERERMVENFRRYSERMSWFCNVPLAEDSSTADLVSVLTDRSEDGSVGYGEHYFGEDYCDAPKHMNLYEACAEVGMPVLFHLGSTEQGLPHLERALNRFPQCTFIAHAPGWWRHILDGTCDRLLSEFPNLYADLSAGSGAKAMTQDPDFGIEFVLRNAGKLLFGTDAIFWSKEIPGEKPQFTLFESMSLPERVQEKVFRANASTMLGL